MKKTGTILAFATLLGCGQEPTTPQPPLNTPPPPAFGLSAPQRFRPSILAVAVTPPAVKPGEIAVLTAQVSSPLPASTMEWVVAVDDASTGNGILRVRSGTGSIRTEFTANYPGEVAFFLHAEDSRGVPAQAARATLTVTR